MNLLRVLTSLIPQFSSTKTCQTWLLGDACRHAATCRVRQTQWRPVKHVLIAAVMAILGGDDCEQFNQREGARITPGTSQPSSFVF